VRLSVPDIPIIVASGTIDEQVRAQLEELKVAGLLNKPFTEQALAQTLGMFLIHGDSP